MKNIKIVEETQCTGCGLCYNICPYNAIAMKENEDGFLFPAVDDKNCRDCGLCVKKCPQISLKFNYKENRTCYAAKADEDTRKACSSGGVFKLIAEKVIESGGVVYGASFDKDCRYLSQKCASTVEELLPLLKSKYLQSDTKKTFSEVKSFLNSGKKVLYCGCPCQIDALYTYLGENTRNLITIDILCHGVPSPKAYNKFLDEVKTANGDKTIKKVDFRDKKYGWGTLISVEFSDGSTHYDYYNGNYFRAFLTGLTMRESCFECKYSNPKRIGDITLGDFWGVKELCPEADDGKGTSLVLCNSEKGTAIIKELRRSMTCIKIPYENTINLSRKTNAALVRPTYKPEMRKCFFYHLNKGDSFSKALKYAETSLLDVGILGWWIESKGSNYGSTLTGYALYKYILSLGLSCAMVFPPDFDREDAGEFNIREGYRMTAKYSYLDMKENNKYIDTYIVGSDVLWYYDAFIETGYTFLLDFASADKRKLSYSTSFGNTKKFFPDEELFKARSFMKRFDAVSVREYEAVDICREKFGINAEHVLDPVFLCDMKNWENLAEKSGIGEIKENYLFAYLLDPTFEKATTIKKLAYSKNLDLITITDKQFNVENKQNILENYGLKKNASIYEFIYYFMNADYIVTDSYHGLCFSLIFRKPFICLINKNRGASRFYTLMKCLDIGDRCIEDVTEISKIAEKEFDYKSVIDRIERNTERSKKWLLKALDSPVKKSISSDIDLITRELVSFQFAVKNLLKRINSLENKE